MRDVQLIHTTFDAGLVVRDRRKALKLGQQALADLVGVSRKWVVGLESGRPRTDFGLVLRTFAALGLTLVATPSPPDAKVSSDPIDPRALDIDAVIERARRVR